MKKIILMLLLAVFTASTYAQETKQEKAKRILNIQEKKEKPPVRVLSEKQKQRKAERILNIDTKKDKSLFDKEKKRKHKKGKHHDHRRHSNK